jgi:small subunit ribosomal protein S3
MGHKVHPKIHRTQVIYTWDSKWFGRKNYAMYAQQDIRIREYLNKKFVDARIDSIGVARGPKNMTITILAAKPGIIIGRGGKGLDDVRKHVERSILQMGLKVKLNIKEVRNPALSARVAALSMASDIERRIRFRRVMKQAIERTMTAGAQGVKVSMAGRLNGAEIARTEKIAKGKIPLITLRSDVDYAFVEANTIYGKIGIKVWIYKGEVFGRKDPLADGDETSEEVTKRSPKKKKRATV